jgi:four helix bundle protein
MDYKIKNFYDLEVWQKGHLFVIKIYKITSKFPNEEKFGITSQMRRATASITANIAEGFARFHFKDKIKFYLQSRGSVAEVQNFLMLAKDLGFIDLNIFNILIKEVDEIGRLINGLIRSINNQNIIRN